MSLYFQKISEGPDVVHSTLWNVTKDKYRPKASTFKIPEDFDEQLEKQKYGPSTKVDQNTVKIVLQDKKYTCYLLFPNMEFHSNMINFASN